MPRPPKKENEHNPLRKLREALGVDGNPIPQYEIAALLGLSTETIKSIEVGRLRVTEKLLEKIYLDLGASWSKKTLVWIDAAGGEPFTLKHSERWCQAGFNRDVETDAMLLRLMVVLDSAPKEKFKKIVDTVEVKLQEILQEFGYQPGYQDVDWRDTQLAIIALGNRGYVRSRSINADGERELFDFSYRRKNLKRNLAATRNKNG